MSTNQPLTREDVTRLLQEVGNSEKLDLSGQKLQFIDLSATSLLGANLRGANLARANLTGANLSGANLRGAILSGANLSGANLSGANLEGAEFGPLEYLDGYGRVNLSGANLRGVDLRGAKVTTEQLLQAYSLEGACMPDGTIEQEEYIDPNIDYNQEATEEAASIRESGIGWWPEHDYDPTRPPEEPEDTWEDRHPYR